MNGLRWISFPRLLGHVHHKFAKPVIQGHCIHSSMLVESCANLCKSQPLKSPPRSKMGAITDRFDDSLETCDIERCSESEPVFKHNHCAPAFTTKMGSWFVLQYHHKLRGLASNSFRHSIVNFSNCLHVEFQILNKLMISSKTFSTVCFLREPGPGLFKAGLR